MKLKITEEQFKIVVNFLKEEIIDGYLIAMAEFEDGNRIFERAYTTREAAEQACEIMVKDISENTDWNVSPIIEDVELVDE